MIVPLNADANKIEINIDIITLCQLKCPYCYSRYDKRKWGKIMKLNDFKKIVQLISNLNGDIQVSLLGGEPTLHPLLNVFLKLLYKTKNVSKVDIYTNGERDLRNLPLDEKLTINYTYHSTETSDDNIFRNIDNLKFKNTVVTTTITKKTKDVAISFYNKCKARGVFFEPTYITSNKTKKSSFISTNAEIDNFKIIDFNGEKLSIKDIYERDLFNFKGHKCFNNSYTIYVNLECFKECPNERYNNLNEMFREIAYRSYICPYERCDDLCMVECKKD